MRQENYARENLVPGDRAAADQHEAPRGRAHRRHGVRRDAPGLAAARRARSEPRRRCGPPAWNAGVNNGGVDSAYLRWWSLHCLRHALAFQIHRRRQCRPVLILCPGCTGTPSNPTSPTAAAAAAAAAAGGLGSVLALGRCSSWKIHHSHSYLRVRTRNRSRHEGFLYKLSPKMGARRCHRDKHAAMHASRSTARVFSECVVVS